MTLPQNASPVSFILTTDRIRAKPFYAGVLGLKVIAEDNFATTFDLGGAATMRLTDLPGHTAMPHTVLGWNVPDIRSAAQELRGKGVTFTVYEGYGQDAEGIWAAPGGSVQVAWSPDPDGNVLSISQFG